MQTGNYKTQTVRWRGINRKDSNLSVEPRSSPARNCKSSIEASNRSCCRPFLVYLPLNSCIALGGKKSPSSVFELVKKFLFSIGRCPFVTFPEYEVVQNATIRSPIGAPEVDWHDVKHVWIFFWNWRNFMVMLTNMTKQIQDKYCCNSSNKV